MGGAILASVHAEILTYLISFKGDLIYIVTDVMSSCGQWSCYILQIEFSANVPYVYLLQCFSLAIITESWRWCDLDISFRAE